MQSLGRPSHCATRCTSTRRSRARRPSDDWRRSGRPGRDRLALRHGLIGPVPDGYLYDRDRRISASACPVGYRGDLSREARPMSQVRSLGFAIPRRYRRLSSDLWRQARLRRRWPRPDHFARMTPDRFESYVRSIGLDLEVRDALDEYDGGAHASRMGTRVHAPKSGTDERRGPSLPGTR